MRVRTAVFVPLANVCMALCGLALCAPAFAACTMTPAGIVSGKGYVVGYAGGPSRLRSEPMGAQFSFRCDGDTSYSLILDGAGAREGVVLLQNGAGTVIPVTPRLHSIDGRIVNVYFRDMKPTGYQDRAVAGKDYLVKVDLIPANAALGGRGVLAGQFSGSVRFALEY